jgi:hypothetical protein
MSETYANVEDATTTGSRVWRTTSRLTYTTSYLISYSVVYTVVFIVHSLPQDNALIHGMYDGGVAARHALRGR